jgi:predicted Zn-dependent protease
VIKRRDLARQLEKRRVSDWALVERTQDIAIADALSREKLTRRREQRVRTSFVVHVDDSRGRGTARIELGSQDEDVGDAVDHAIELAIASIGPGWRTVPASAPAKVSLLDPAIGKRDILDIAVGIAGSLRAAPPVTAAVCARVMREQIVVDTAVGLTSKWDASTYEIDALVADARNSIAVRREARREADLDLAGMLGAATSDLAFYGTIETVKPGPCTLVLDANSFLHDGITGVWSVFATQADAVLERQGLTRYRVGVPVAPGADTVPEPLTITSNGALDFGLLSAPLDDLGAATRRFPVVDRGIAKSLGLTPREAALRGRDPNGGVRNLVVAPGTWDGQLPASTMRVIEVRRLRALSIDPYTGEASLELAIAVEHGAKEKRFAGGTIRLDLVAALAHARRAATTIHRGAYQGPDRILIERADLVT